MKIAFAGTPAFAAQALQALAQVGHQIVLVLTQPDRPAGRGLKLQASPVKQLAQTLGAPGGLQIAQPRSLRLDGKFPDDASAARQALQAAAPQLMVVAAYGLILPAWVLQLPPLGCLNIHASLLPRWRGAAPIHRAIEAGDSQTGITIMQMDEGLDTGPMLLTATEDIHADDNTQRLHDRLALLGASLCVQALQQAQAGSLVPQAQPPGGACYAKKIDKAEAALDWQRPAAELERRVRAFDPAPGCHTTLVVDGQARELKVWRAALAEGRGAPGQVLEAGPGRLVVACAQGALELLELQVPGGKRQTATELRRRWAAAS